MHTNDKKLLLKALTSPTPIILWLPLLPGASSSELDAAPPPPWHDAPPGPEYSQLPPPFRQQPSLGEGDGMGGGGGGGGSLRW